MHWGERAVGQFVRIESRAAATCGEPGRMRFPSALNLPLPGRCAYAPLEEKDEKQHRHNVYAFSDQRYQQVHNRSPRGGGQTDSRSAPMLAGLPFAALLLPVQVVKRPQAEMERQGD